MEGEPVTEQDEPSDKKDNGQEYTAQRLEIATANFIRQSRSTPKDYTALKKRLQTLKKYFDHENEQGTGGTSKSCDIIQNSGAGVLLVDTIKDLMVAGHRTPDLLEQNSEIISVSLHILGNFFHSISEKQEGECNLLQIIQQVLIHPFLSSVSQIVHRSLRLIANVIRRHKSFTFLFGDGLLESVLALIPKLKERVTNPPASWDNETEKYLSAFLRCIRAFGSDRNTKLKINRRGGLTVVTEPLCWEEATMKETFKLEILQLLNFLVEDKMVAVTRETINKLKQTSEGAILMETIIKTYKNFGPLSELCKMSEVVLRNFMTNETLMSGLVEHGIYEAIFHQISKSEAPSILDSQLQLMRHVLLKASGYMPTFLYAPTIPSCIVGTLKILLIRELQQHHVMVWWLYENVPTTGINSLISAGLMDVIKAYFRQIYDVVSLDDVRMKLSGALDMTECYIPAEIHMERENSISSEGDPSSSIPVCETYIPHHLGYSNSISPGQSSPNSSSGVFSLTEAETDNEAYSPMASDFGGSDCSDVEDVNEVPENIGQLEGEPPFPKRMKLETSSQLNFVKMNEAIPVIFNSSYKVTLVATILSLVRKLLYTILKDELHSLMPTFLGLFLDASLHRTVSYEACEMRCTTVFTMWRSIKQIYVSTASILENLFKDEKPFLRYITEGLPSILQRMRIICETLPEVSLDLTTLMSFVSGKTSIRKSKLNNYLSSCTEKVDKVKVATSLPILYPCSVKFNWFGNCSQALISALKNQEELSLFDLENTFLSVISMCNFLSLKWDSLHESMQAVTLPNVHISNAESLIQEHPSHTTVTFVLDDGSELHVEKQLLVDTSPVFEAMLDGNFYEAKVGRIRLTEVSKESITAFIEQVQVSLMRRQSLGEESDKDDEESAYSLDLLLDILSLFHRYMFFGLYNRAVNTILGKRLSPETILPIYILLNKRPQYPSDTKNPDALPLKGMTMLYFLTTQDINLLRKVSILKGLFKACPESLLSDLELIFDTFT